MQFYENKYYHIYNRTNNEEALFRTEENYLYFLKKYRFYLEDYFEPIGYCLMPTHFHFLVRVKSIKNSSDDLKSSDEYKRSSDEFSSKIISNQIAICLRSYTRAYNKMWNRHGNLFNQKTNAKIVESENYLINLLTYIHQNPLRSKLVDKAENWNFSSYRDYIDFRNGTLPNKEIILNNINKDELKEFTERKLLIIKK